MALKGRKPEPQQKRLKFFLFGPTNVGKTTILANFPNSYYIDTEDGSGEYWELFEKNNSVLYQTNSIVEVLDEMDQLLTTKHPYRNLIIDPETILYEDAQEVTSKIFEKYAKTEQEKETGDFGMRYWPKVKGYMKSLRRKITRLDMNVIITSHQKDLYGNNFNKIGVGPDTIKGADYFFDLAFKLSRNEGIATFDKVKERGLYVNNKFPVRFEVELEKAYDFIADAYGREIIERESVPIVLATQEQVAKANHLIEVLNIEPDVLAKWFSKINVDSTEEMSNEEITKFIEFLTKKIEG